MKEITIMTFNVQFGKRLDYIIHWLRQAPGQDIVCFQEFPEDRIVYFINELNNLSYGYRFARSLLRRHRVYGELTLFRTPDFRCTRSTVIEFGINRIEGRLFKGSFPRNCLICTLLNKKKIFVVGNAHMSALALNRLKYKEAELVVRMLESRRYPSVILGDFNISSVLGKGKLVRLMEKYGFVTEKRRLSTHRIAVVRHQFDYIFAKRCEVANMTVQKVRFSDHYPVFAVVRIIKEQENK